jgi:signal recognition particle subunit SRP54
MGAATVDEVAVREFVRDLQRTLLQADVNVKLVLELTSRIQERALKERPPPGLPRKDHVVKILYEELVRLMGEESRFEPPADRLYKVLLVGIQGSGKTTTVAKLARYLRKRGHRVGVVGADTYRPGALAQLQMLCEPIGVEVYGRGKGDPVKIAQEGVSHFAQALGGRGVVLIDTAGRHKEEQGLIREMEALARVIVPDITLLVVDATIGQQCYAQAEAFHRAVRVGGIVLTKLDGAAKGGGALAAAAATGARIYFVGTGERIDDLDAFSPTRFVGRLLGLGDLKALLERARELEVEADEKRLRRMVSGKMTIEDLYYQLEQLRKFGSLRRLLDLIPGLSSAVKEADLEGLEERLNRWKSIIQSMTREERANPDILNSSRVRRIARGAGVREAEVREMLAKYRQTKALLRSGKGRAMRQLLSRFRPGE